MENKYRLPWKVEYATDNEDKIEVYDGKKTVVSIKNCDGSEVVETDWGYYGPKEEVAEFIVKCVNESWRAEGMNTL